MIVTQLTISFQVNDGQLVDEKKKEGTETAPSLKSRHCRERLGY